MNCSRGRASRPDSNPDLYLPGKVGGVVAAEVQHVLHLLEGVGDQGIRLLWILLILLQLRHELCLFGGNHTWRTEEEARGPSETLLHETASGSSPEGKH